MNNNNSVITYNSDKIFVVLSKELNHSTTSTTRIHTFFSKEEYIIKCLETITNIIIRQLYNDVPSELQFLYAASKRMFDNYCLLNLENWEKMVKKCCEVYQKTPEQIFFPPGMDIHDYFSDQSAGIPGLKAFGIESSLPINLKNPGFYGRINSEILDHNFTSDDFYNNSDKDTESLLQQPFTVIIYHVKPVKRSANGETDLSVNTHPHTMIFLSQKMRFVDEIVNERKKTDLFGRENPSEALFQSHIVESPTVLTLNADNNNNSDSEATVSLISNLVSPIYQEYETPEDSF